MSKTIKWLIVIIIVILALLWWTGNLSLTGTSQSGAVINSAPTSALDQINRDVASIDTQMQGATTDLSSADLTQAQIASALNHFKTVTTLMTALNVKLNSASVNSKSVVTIKASIADMARNLSNAGSQLSVTAKNIANVSAVTKASVNPALKQAVTDLKVSQGYLVLARADIAAVISSLK